MNDRPGARGMLFRFSLYGFLKNQQYYEPFLILAMRSAGLDFFAIGLLVGFREIAINVMEVPSGALADLWGRRRAMMLSFVAFIASFAVFAFSSHFAHFLAAMALFAVGDAFRTGTHKAMIFDYLRREGLADQKTRYYGTTRSWAKFGSAVSVVLASTLVFFVAAVDPDGRDAYRWVFLASIVPYLGGLVNFWSYPSYLDGTAESAPSVTGIFGHLWQVGRQSLAAGRLRGLLGESMGFEGVWKVARSYLQPIVRSAALALPLLAGFDDVQRTAVMIGAVYVVLHLLESAASRRSEGFSLRMGGLEPSAGRLWWLNLATYGAMAAGLAADWHTQGTVAGLGLAVAIGGFVLLAFLQNLWRPIHLGRFDEATDADRGATVLSVESQAKSLFAAVLAPLLGLAVDASLALREGRHDPASFLPVAAAGLAAAGLAMALRARRGRVG